MNVKGNELYETAIKESCEEQQGIILEKQNNNQIEIKKWLTRI